MWLEFLIVSVIQHSDAEATFIKDTIASFSPATSHTVGKLFQDELYPKSGYPSFTYTIHDPKVAYRTG